MRKISINLILLIGIILIFYPFIGNIINKFNQTKVINNYKKEISSMSFKEKEQRKIEYQKYNNGKCQIDLLETKTCLAYIEIPKIKICLPIYEGTSDEILLKGIGHLKDTSLPIGGKNTNCVLVGHTGITAKTFFDNITELEINDSFYINILDEILKYKVIDIKIVLPNDTDSIKKIKGKDLITLVTCTPKYINSHRLLVVGERV